MQKTGIEYLTHTWNPIAMRCTKCSPGCDGCWHLRTADRLCQNTALPEDERKALSGEGPFILRERELSSPLKIKKHAVIGVQFMGDLFHEAVPIRFIAYTLLLMKVTPKHIYLVLTKRPQRMKDIIENFELAALTEYCWQDDKGNTIDLACGLPDNIYLGLTVCNQQEVDEKLPIFLQVPGKKFLSIEPMLGAVDFKKHLPMRIPGYSTQMSRMLGHQSFPIEPPKIDAVILGGETSARARPMHPDWVRSIRDQCQSAGVPFFFKGMLFDKKHKTMYIDGKTHTELPWRDENAIQGQGSSKNKSARKKIKMVKEASFR